MGSPNPYQALVSNPDIALEFKSKVEELSRRLNANGFNYQNDYSVMNDRQRDIFTTGLFVMPEQADSIEEYVEFGHDNCECPDVMEDLDQTCPMLMQGVNTINEREKVQESNIIETTLDLIIEQLINEVVLQEASRGVMNPDKLGMKLNNEAGDIMQSVGQQFIKIGDPKTITDTNSLVLAVHQVVAKANKITPPTDLEKALADNKLKDLFLWSGTKNGAAAASEITKSKAAQILLVKYQPAGKKAPSKGVFAFVLYSNKTNNSPWKEQDFKALTGFGSKKTQSGQEIKAVGPDLFGAKGENITPLASVPGMISRDVLATLDQKLAETLPGYIEAAVAGQPLPILQFETPENREQYMKSLGKYLSEVTGPIFLATGKYLKPVDKNLEQAYEALLQPYGVASWAATDGVQWPTSKTAALKDSFLHYGGGAQPVGVSSKSGKGANPSVTELYKLLATIKGKPKEELLELYGPNNTAGVNLYTGDKANPGIVDIMADKQYQWWSLPARLAVEITKDPKYTLTQGEYEEWLKISAAQLGNGRENIPVKLPKLSAGLRKKLAAFMKLTGSKSIGSKKYRQYYHALAGMAAYTTAAINGAKDGEGNNFFTQFAKAMYNASPLVQIYAKGNAYVEDGETGVKSGDLLFIYPARFDGLMRIDAGKNYYSTGNNGKMTVEIK